MCCIAHKHARQRTDTLNDQAILGVYLRPRAEMYQIYLPRSRDNFRTKHASFDEMEFSLATVIQTEHVQIDEWSEPNNSSSSKEEILDATFLGSYTRRTLDNHVQPAFLDLVEQEEVQRTLENPDDVTPHQNIAEETREALVG